MPPMTLEEATEHVVTTDPRFALTFAKVRGVEVPVFANAPPTIRALQEAGAAIREGGDYIVYESERIGYDAWLAQTNRVAAVLTGRLGVKPGDRVAIAMRNYPEYLTLIMAIASVGAVAVLINAWWTTEELRYGFEDSGARLVFADGPRAERISAFGDALGLTLVMVRDAPLAEGMQYETLLSKTPEAPRPDVAIDPDADFAIMYSSGSTGHPKGVVLTHRGAISATYSWLIAFSLIPLMMKTPPTGPKAAQAILLTTPLFHVTATHPCFLLSIPLGAKFVMMHKWDPERAVDLIEREGVTRFLGVPTMTAELAEAARRMGRTLPTLSNLGSGGAKRPPAQVAEQQAVFPHAAVASGWGMTETNALGIGIQGEEYLARPDAAGRLYPPLQALRIIDDAWNEQPVGARGEIAVKSAALMRCYLNKPEETAEAIQDGWFRTGDLGVVDAEGYVTILDRKKNIIIRGGENISGLEVEHAIHRHPAVFEAAAFAVPDDRLGEVVGVQIMLKPGAMLTEDALLAFLAEHLAKFKQPERIWWSETPLMRGPTDKIDRRAIRTACIEEGAA